MSKFYDVNGKLVHRKPGENSISQTILWKRKDLSSNLDTASTEATDLTFNNLIVGRTYKVTLQAFFTSLAVDAEIGLDIENGATQIAFMGFRGGGSQVRESYGITRIFTATDTTLTFTTNGAAWSVNNYLNNAATVATLEQLPNHVESEVF